MIAQFPKPPGFASVTTPRPCPKSVPLGRVLRAVADRYALESPQDEAGLVLDAFLREHERYADSQRIVKLSCPHAIKAWAAERLPILGVSYGYANRITKDAVQANLDEQAPMALVEFADDLTLIAGFCRNVEQLSIDSAIHPQGLAFRFTFRGQLRSDSREEIEQQSVSGLLRSTAGQNCLKLRVFATERQVEAEAIVLRKRVRLGFTPLS